MCQCTTRAVSREYAAKVRSRRSAGEGPSSIARGTLNPPREGLGGYRAIERICADLDSGGYHWDPVDDEVAIQRFTEHPTMHDWSRLSHFERLRALEWAHEEMEKERVNGKADEAKWSIFAGAAGYLYVRNLDKAGQGAASRQA